jgi:HTH-type transcriptional regulator, sugar sensing transcriptional regulator
MNPTMDSQILMGVGLTPKEADVYLALVELGATSATNIIQKTGLHRAVVYDLLGRLIEKGLVGHVIKGRKKVFEATNPSRLLEILKEKEERVMTILPKLMELSNFKEHLDVKIYKGKEGIKNVFEDIIRDRPKEWLSLGSAGETYQLFPAFLDEFHKNRIKAKIIARGLISRKPIAKERAKKLTKMTLTEIRFLPKSFLTPTVINIYGEKVTLYSVTKEKIPFIILLENKQIALSFKEYFEWLWKLAKY